MSAATLRVAFAGTPEFAATALAAIHAAGHVVPLVLTQPDRPAGRGMKLTPSAVKQLALDLGVPVAQPRSLRLDGKFPDDALGFAARFLEGGPGSGGVLIETDYTVHVDLPGYPMDLHFHPQSKNKSAF